MLAGCQSGRETRSASRELFYRTPSHAVRRLAERAQAVRSVSAEGTLTLRGASGGSTTLDIALVAAGADRLRLRAWKFNQAVLDLTLNEEGLWLWFADGGGGPSGGRAAAMKLTAERLARAWGLVSGRLFREAPQEIARRGDALIARYEGEGGGAVLAEIDRASLTVRRYVLLGPEGRPRLSLALGGYARVGGQPWPRRLVASSPRRRLVLRLRGVTLNEPPPAGAFTPPRRATRTPRQPTKRDTPPSSSEAPAADPGPARRSNPSGRTAP